MNAEWEHKYKVIERGGEVVERERVINQRGMGDHAENKLGDSLIRKRRISDRDTIPST